MSEPRGLWTIKPSMREVEEAIDAERRNRKEVEAERDAYRAALDRLIETGDWYARCLEDVQDSRPVRGLDEAKVGWTNALYDARAVLAGDHDQGAQT